MKIIIAFLVGLIMGGLGMYYYLSSSWDFTKKGGKGGDIVVRQTILNTYAWDKGGSGSINLDLARYMHRRYMERCFENHEDTTKVLRSLWVDRSSIEGLFKPGDTIQGIRIYLGLKADSVGKDHIPLQITNFLVGVDRKGIPYVPKGLNSSRSASEEIVDNLPPCPDDCPDNDVLRP